MSEQSIGDLIRKAESDYTTGTTTIGKYVEFSQYENIEKIDAYLNSKHISGDVDSMGREKPFFNIVTSAVNIWFRATDIDRKNIRIKATKSKDFIGAFLATIHLQTWMKRASFGSFLNDWGRSLARYGSSVLKFVEKGGMLYAEVIPWNRLISDTVDFENNIKIEKLFFTESQLRSNNAYDKNMVEALISARQARETQDGQKKDNKNDYYEVYECHGVLPLSFITERESDKDKFVQQMHVLSFVRSKETTKEYDDFCLLKGREKKDPYMITHLIKEDGRAQAIGAVEHLFESQWMSNHTAKQIKDQLDLASKLIFQTADTNFAGMNALDNIETGDILIHKDNSPITQIANNSHDITSIQAFGQQWQVLGKEITSTPDSISGNTMPSGTAYRQVAILNQESHSLFEIMTENKGLYIEEMMRKFVIPYLKTLMDTSEEISATLDEQSIKQIDSMYVKSESIRRHNAKVAYEALNNKPIVGLNIDEEQAKIQEELAVTGNQRFIKPSSIPTKTWKELFKDLEWDVEVEVTAEQSDKDSTLTSLNTIFQTIVGLQGRPLTGDEKLVFNKILETTGAVSPVEMATAPQQQPSQPQQVAMANNQVAGGQQNGGSAKLQA